MDARQFVRWYFKHVWNIVRDEPPPNATVEPCHCGKKHWGEPCKGWMFKDKSVVQLKKERKVLLSDIQRIDEASKRKSVDLTYEAGVGIAKRVSDEKSRKPDRDERRALKSNKRNSA